MNNFLLNTLTWGIPYNHKLISITIGKSMWAEILRNRASLLTILSYLYLKYASAVKTGCRIITQLSHLPFYCSLIFCTMQIYTYKAHAFFSSCGNHSSILMCKPSLDLLQIIARSINGPGRKTFDSSQRIWEVVPPMSNLL